MSLPSYPQKLIELQKLANFFLKFAETENNGFEVDTGMVVLQENYGNSLVCITILWSASRHKLPWGKKKNILSRSGYSKQQ